MCDKFSDQTEFDLNLFSRVCAAKLVPRAVCGAFPLCMQTNIRETFEGKVVVRRGHKSVIRDFLVHATQNVGPSVHFNFIVPFAENRKAIILGWRWCCDCATNHMGQQ
jgi:hypothetical protein